MATGFSPTSILSLLRSLPRTAFPPDSRRYEANRDIPVNPRAQLGCSPDRRSTFDSYSESDGSTVFLRHRAKLRICPNKFLLAGLFCGRITAAGCPPIASRKPNHRSFFPRCCKIMRMTALSPTLTDDPETATNDFRTTRGATAHTATADRSNEVSLPIPWQEHCYTPAEVAALRSDRILTMSRTELIGVLRSVRGNHLRSGLIDRLPQMDGETLRKLVFLTRRFCRNQQALDTPLAEFCGAGARSW